MPFVHPHVALMPDAHFGKGSAVGTVIPTIDAVIPAAVGVDIGCGMIAARTVFTLSDVEGRDLAALRESIESAIPLSPGNYNSGTDRYPFTAERITDLRSRAEADGVDLTHSPKWRRAAGLARWRQPFHRTVRRRGIPAVDVPAFGVARGGQQDRAASHQGGEAAVRPA